MAEDRPKPAPVVVTRRFWVGTELTVPLLAFTIADHVPEARPFIIGRADFAPVEALLRTRAGQLVPCCVFLPGPIS